MARHPLIKVVDPKDHDDFLLIEEEDYDANPSAYVRWEDRLVTLPADGPPEANPTAGVEHATEPPVPDSEASGADDGDATEPPVPDSEASGTDDGNA